MLIHWLATFFVLLPSDFVLVYSRVLPKSHEDQQWTSSAVDGADDGTRRDELLGSSLNTRAAQASINIRKVSIYSDRQQAIGHRRSVKTGVSFEEKDYQKDLRMIAALSKIAKVRVAEEDPFIIAQRLKESKISAQAKAMYSPNNYNFRENTVEITGTPSNISSPLSSDSTSSNAFNKEVKQRSLRCEAQGGIYITDINEYVPSYICKLGSNTLFLASKRFWHDCRNNLDLSVDDDTLRRLINVSATKSRPRMVEVILALKPDGKNYEIRN